MKELAEVEGFTQEKLQEMLAFAKKHNLAEMMWQENELRIAFKRNTVAKAKPVAAPQSSPAQKMAQATPELPSAKITSPIVGTFRRSLTKDRPPIVVEGTHVKAGDRVGIVECMKIPNDVIAHENGVITKVLLEDGHVVEYGQPIFELSTSENASVNGKK